MSDTILSQVVQFLGLNELESKVYEYLIAHKEVNISEIAKITLSNRVQIYRVFDVLADLNLIDKPLGRNKKIVVLNPKNILIKLRQKQLEAEKYLKQFEDILPDLEHMQALSNRSIPIKIVQGRREFEDLFLEMYDNASNELMFIGNSDEFSNFLGENYIDFATRKRVKREILYRILSFEPGINLKQRKNENSSLKRLVRFLPAKFQSLGYVNIYDDKVVNWNTHLARAVVIQDAVIASFYKTIFEILWMVCE